MQKLFRVGVLCGGPSPERGISLNSARCLLDHIESNLVEVVPYYMNLQKKIYAISKAQLYSNTPSDFDFKLENTAKALTEHEFIHSLKKLDIVFPAMHGAFGEDGQIQTLLEKHAIPFVGSSSTACQKAFDKYAASLFLQKQNFFTLSHIVIGKKEKNIQQKIQNFFIKNNLSRVIIKPVLGGSSIGVSSADSVRETYKKVTSLFSQKYTRVLIEEFAKGKEFTVLVLQNKNDQPVALIPSEIETGNQLFDFRKKYLPTRQVIYHCPPRFSPALTTKIQSQAEKLFTLFAMRDFVRIDGWVLSSGEIWFSDINPISGMEQNSFLFQQATRIGFSHQDVLSYILRHAAKRYGLSFPQKQREKQKKKKNIAVLFGGSTSERQVSVMSGTNVWLKLRKSQKYNPQPFLLDEEKNVWHLPYALTLNHTVEEIVANCKLFTKNLPHFQKIVAQMRDKLLLAKGDISQTLFSPKKMSLQEFIKQSSFIFIALHGGLGEDGTLQKVLEKSHVAYNGSGAKVSQLCMNKAQTTERIKQLNISGVQVASHVLVPLSKLRTLHKNDYQIFWKDLQEKLQSTSIIAKPNSDGCSSGVVRLYTEEDLDRYSRLLAEKASFIPGNTFTNQKDIIEMPQDSLQEVLFETCIETDTLRVLRNKVKHIKKTGWIEVTVGVIEEKKKMHVFNPSITIVEGEVLSVEEKFQGGTGVNMTPPPVSLISEEILRIIKKRIQLVAEKVGIQGYSRIDAFVQRITGEVSIIEINTLPGLTPSTVFFQQALAEPQPIYPTQLLEKLINNKL